MLDLHLSEPEARDLDQALRRDLTRLMEELVHTDDRAYRASLRASYDRLEGLERKVRDVIGPAVTTEH